MSHVRFNDSHTRMLLSRYQLLLKIENWGNFYFLDCGLGSGSVINGYFYNVYNVFTLSIFFSCLYSLNHCGKMPIGDLVVVNFNLVKLVLKLPMTVLFRFPSKEMRKITLSLNISLISYNTSTNTHVFVLMPPVSQ